MGDKRYFALLLAFGLGLWVVPWLAAVEPLAPERSLQTLTYYRLYADQAGQSHFAEDELDFVFEQYAPPAGPLGLNKDFDAKGMTFVQVPGNTFEDWHPVPRRQFMFILKGMVEVTAGDGEVRRFTPGDIVLLEDTFGIGHTTRTVNEAGNISVAVPVIAP